MSLGIRFNGAWGGYQPWGAEKKLQGGLRQSVVMGCEFVSVNRPSLHHRLSILLHPAEKSVKFPKSPSIVLAHAWAQLQYGNLPWVQRVSTFFEDSRSLKNKSTSVT